jgi:hypothetical protein
MMYVLRDMGVVKIAGHGRVRKLDYTSLDDRLRSIYILQGYQVQRCLMHVLDAIKLFSFVRPVSLHGQDQVTAVQMEIVDTQDHEIVRIVSVFDLQSVCIFEINCINGFRFMALPSRVMNI